MYIYIYIYIYIIIYIIIIIISIIVISSIIIIIIYMFIIILFYDYLLFDPCCFCANQWTPYCWVQFRDTSGGTCVWLKQSLAISKCVMFIIMRY